MKQSRFAGLLLCAAMSLLLTNCNNNTDDKSTTTSVDSNTASANTPAPADVNTIITTPQGMMTVTHKVADFDKWKASYEANDSLRLAYGIHNYVIGRGEMDPSVVLVAVKVDDMAKAEAFAKSPALKEAMKKSGVMGMPTVSFVTATYQDTATLSTDLRSRTTFTVKDWDAWAKNFTEGKQERLDNGVIERMYGYDPHDNKKVALVTAITDTAKAFAYWKSDMLKKRRMDGGVTTEPVRFVFHIVQRYH
jgi:hypothetical protein